MRSMTKLYSQSLYSLSKDENIESVILDDLKVINDTLKENDEFINLLLSRSISNDERNAIIDDVYCSLNEYSLNFVKLLCDKKCIKYFDEIFNIFRKLYNEDNNICDVSVISATNLSDDLKLRLKEKLEKEMKKNVNITYKIDSKILGGIIIQSDGMQQDASVKSRINSIKKHLLASDN